MWHRIVGPWLARLCSRNSHDAIFVLFTRRTVLLRFYSLEFDMAKKVKARKMGGSIGATLPKDIVDRLHIEEGDELTVIETDEGVLITPYDPTFDEAMGAYEKGAREYRNALKKLSE